MAAALPSTVRPCIDEAVARSGRLIDRAIAHGAAALQESARRQAASAQRMELASAAHELELQRMDWSARFPQALRNAIANGGNAKPRLMASPSSLTLTLVDEGEVMESIEAARLAQQLAGPVEKQLAELDRYMSTAFDCDTIQPEANPLRPIIIAQALRSLITDGGAAPGRADLWMRSMADPIGEELCGLYQSCVQLLTQAGVKPADYKVITSPSPLTPNEPERTPPPPPPSYARPAATGFEPTQPPSSDPVPLRPAGDSRKSLVSGWADLAANIVRGSGLRDFLFGGAPHAHEALAPIHYRQVEEELAALEAQGDEAPPDPHEAQRYRHLSPVERPPRVVGTDSPLSHDLWGLFGAPRQRKVVRTHLRQKAQRVGQVIGIDVVRELVGQVAQDPRLLAPVREAIVALEPSFARLALHAPRFFGEENNPARQLLEAVAQRSFRYNDEFAPAFEAFFDGVRAEFNKLNEIEALFDALPFERSLARLQNAWSLGDMEEERQRRRVLRAVEHAEARQANADQIAWDLSQRSDLEGSPAVVQDFLFGPWTLVIAQDRMEHPNGGPDPGGYVAVIADLLWSVKPSLTLRDPARAFELIPRVVAKLRDGLHHLGHPPGETEAFFQALERLHRPVLKLRAKHRKQSLHAEIAQAPTDPDLQPAPAQKPKPRAEPWLGQAELRDCGFGDTVPFVDSMIEPIHEAHAATQPSPASVNPDAAIARLQQGDWVDLYARQQWRRAQLTWVSGNRALFMFVSDKGLAHSMTSRTLQRLVATRMVRPVDSQPVVQQALAQLMLPREDALAA